MGELTAKCSAATSPTRVGSTRSSALVPLNSTTARLRPPPTPVSQLPPLLLLLLLLT